MMSSCSTCSKQFPSEFSRYQHERDKHSPQKRLQQFYNENVVPSKNDFKESKAIVRSSLLDVLRNIRDPIYSVNMQNAGSVSTNTKINKADEFDFELPLNIPDFRVNRSSYVNYGFVEDSRSMNIVKTVATERSDVPGGYVQVEAPNAPENLRVGKFLAPRKIHEDLYKKLSNAGVTLQRLPHGPALTFTILTKDSHNIEVDLVPSLYDTKTVKVSREVWQRAFFRRKQSLVEELKEVPILLIPKQENAWLVSYEKLTKHMLNKIDTYGTCRKACHKMLKYDFMKMKSEESFEGISTYPFKHHLLWFSDNHPDDQYWDYTNFKRCYVEMLEDLAKCLRNRNIPNYFNTNFNQLGGKNPEVLKRLARKIDDLVKKVDREFK